MIKTQLTESDTYTLIQLGYEFMKEGRFKDHDYNPDKVLQLLEATIRAPQKFFVAFDENHRGVILLGMSQHYFSSYKWATDFAFFVAPEHRGGLLGRRLLKEGERWAKENGASELTILHNTGIKTDTAARFFNGAGYETKGHIFTKEL